jgi:HTH-type transcriptional regulator, competence development regulator
VSKNISLGSYIRKLREDKGLLLRQSAAFLEVDTAFISKVERGERKLNKVKVEKLAAFLQTDTEEMLTIWLTERILNLINDEREAEAALRLALKECKRK